MTFKRPELQLLFSLSYLHTWLNSPREWKKTINAVLKFDLFDAKHLHVVSQDPIREKRNYKHSKCAYKCLILCAVVRWLASAETIEVLVWMNKYILAGSKLTGCFRFCAQTQLLRPTLLSYCYMPLLYSWLGCLVLALKVRRENFVCNQKVNFLGLQSV